MDDDNGVRADGGQDIPLLVTTGQLAGIMGTSEERAALFVVPINTALHTYDITTTPRICAFLAQVGHESGGLRYSRELWGPTKQQAGYEGRADLGNTSPGDGYRYRGRGLIQITGRANYEACGRCLGVDFVKFPERMETPMNAALSAGWFWSTRNLNALADARDFTGITRRINGGTNGLSDRISYLNRAESALA